MDGAGDKKVSETWLFLVQINRYAGTHTSNPYRASVWITIANSDRGHVTARTHDIDIQSEWTMRGIEHFTLTLGPNLGIYHVASCTQFELLADSRNLLQTF